MRPLITGISGFVGSHLAEHLKAAGAEVFGLAREQGDILDEAFVRRTLSQAKPTHVFHCAAALAGETDTRLLYETNVIGTATLFASIVAAGLKPVVVVAGSSAVYGRPQSLPVTEDHPFAPLTPYAASKVGQEMVALAHFLSDGIPVIRVRTFNLIGPGQSASLAASSLAQQIAAAEAGGPAVIRVGNLDGRRDYTDVRDAVRAYALLAQRAVPGEAYNVCSGVSRSIRQALDILMAEARRPVTVEVDQQRYKSGAEIDEQRGSFERVRRETGWQPAIDFAQSLRDLLEYWRSK